MHRVHAAYLGGLSTRLADHISVAYAQMSHRRKKRVVLYMRGVWLSIYKRGRRIENFSALYRNPMSLVTDSYTQCNPNAMFAFVSVFFNYANFSIIPPRSNTFFFICGTSCTTSLTLFGSRFMRPFTPFFITILI